MSYRNIWGSDPWGAYETRSPFRLFDQHFGSTLAEDDLLPYTSYPMASQIRPRRFRSRQESGISEIRGDKNKFEVMLDVQQFLPSEISCKTVDNIVIITGQHEEKPDEHGMISRSFTRKYNLPEDVMPDSVQCNLSSDGVLTVTAQRIDKTIKGNERPINIIQTGQPAIKKETGGPPSPQPQPQNTQKEPVTKEHVIKTEESK